MTDCRPVIVYPLLFTTAKRCDYHPNPRRPTWRCKRAPTRFIRFPDHMGLSVCDDCLALLTAGCP